MVKHCGMSIWFFLLTAGSWLSCGQRGEELQGEKKDGERTGAGDTVAALIAHSTVADTSGMHADLRIIERKLGPLAPDIRDQLEVVEVRYFSFIDSTYSAVDKEKRYTGVLLVHSCIADDVRRLFQAFEQDTFPIAKVVPINRYGLNADSTGWNDPASMADNNTSAFNYRGKAHVPETSKHAQGIAIDINPEQNPLVIRTVTGSMVEPKGASYRPDSLGSLNRTNTAKYLRALGWSWGGRWPRPQDHQHIEKSRGSCAHLRFTLR